MTEKINLVVVHKRRMRVIVLVILMFGVSQGLTADWVSILEQAKKKYAKFEEEVKDMTLVLETKMVTPEGEMVCETKHLRKGKKFRGETTVQMPDTAQMPKGMREIKSIIIYDGKDTWMILPFMGKKKLSYEEEKPYYRYRNWWEFISEKAKIVGTQKVGKRDCYVVKIEERRKCPFLKVWLDRKNLISVKAEIKGAEGKTSLLVYSDFRKIRQGWEIPYKYEMYGDGNLISTSVVKSVEINKSLSADLFDPDKVKVKELDMPEIMKKAMKEGGGKYANRCAFEQ